MVKKDYLAFIGTNSVRGSQGIYSLRLDGETLRPELLATRQVYNSGALAWGGRRLYAASEGMTFKGKADGGAHAFACDAAGMLTETSAQRSFGQRTCAITVDPRGKNLYGANFYQGTWVAWPLDENGDLLPARLSVAPPEEAGPFRALHCVEAIGDDYVAVISLAECALVVYRASNGERVTSFVFPGHPFCRYLAVRDRMIYAMMQDPGDIYVFRSDLEEKGVLTLLQTISVQEQPLAHYATTTLRFTSDGALLIAATRENSTLTLFSVQADGTLARKQILTLPGQAPRDFAITPDGHAVVTCLQKTDEICVHRIESETLLDTGWKLSIPSPAAAAITMLDETLRSTRRDT